LTITSALKSLLGTFNSKHDAEKAMENMKQCEKS